MSGTFLRLLFAFIFFYGLFSVGYLFILSVCGWLFYKREELPDGGDGFHRRIAILVPAYREDGIILSTVGNLLNQAYPPIAYDIYVIADGFRADTLAALEAMPVKVVEVKFEKSTKTKSLNEAFRRMSEPYDIVLISDADNMLKEDFLLRINYAFACGARAVQGRRVAKNLDTPFAILDACSEAVNNHIFRRGSNAVGLSSAVIGSGMAFEAGMVGEILSRIDAVGGFDKVLQLEIVKRGICIRYLEDALIFDEKVSSSGAFQQQRRRWVSSQFIYLRRFFVPAFAELMRGNVSYFNLAVLCNLVLPRAFLFVLSNTYQRSRQLI